MIDYNIEVSHIYADERFGEEQIGSLKLVKEFVRKIQGEGKSYVVSVLIDDFNAISSSLNVEKLVSEIKKYGVDVDFVGYESKFVSVADKVIVEIPKAKLNLECFHKPEKEVLFLKDDSNKVSLKTEYEFSYRHTCAILDVSWSLCRLGLYDLPFSSVDNLAENKSFVAKEVVNIIPKKFESVGRKVHKIISETRFRDCCSKIKYLYF